MMRARYAGYCLVWVMGLALPVALGQIESVKVINDTSTAIYTHQGGYAPSQMIEAGKWRIYPYPFEVTPPNSRHLILSSLLVATAGGRWETTANGFTFLSKPRLVACLDYTAGDAKHKTGQRIWTISSKIGKQENCMVRGFRQLWWQPPY